MNAYWPPMPYSDDLVSAVLYSVQAEHYGRENDPHLDASREHAAEQVALKARELVRAVDALPESGQPIGWSQAAQDADADGGAVRNVYLDCEFLPADGSTRGLVSIGLTDDAGRDYYAVNAEMDTAAVLAVPWMVENVWSSLPVDRYHPGHVGDLDLADPVVRPLWQIRHDIAAYFAGTTAETTHLYAYYGGQDICRLHSLWDNNWAVMPKTVPRWFFDIKALAVQAGSPELPVQESGEHNALEDARYNRTLHQFLAAL